MSSHLNLDDPVYIKSLALSNILGFVIQLSENPGLEEFDQPMFSIAEKALENAVGNPSDQELMAAALFQSTNVLDQMGSSRSLVSSKKFSSVYS